MNWHSYTKWSLVLDLYYICSSFTMKKLSYFIRRFLFIFWVDFLLFFFCCGGGCSIVGGRCLICFTRELKQTVGEVLQGWSAMAAVEEKQTLLNKKHDYDEECPGCKVEQIKQGQTGLPIKELFSVWFVVLCTGKFHTLISLRRVSIIPYIYSSTSYDLIYSDFTILIT